MSNNFSHDLEANLEMRPQRDDQDALLDAPRQDRENAITDFRNAFEYSLFFNIGALVIPVAKIIVSIWVLAGRSYSCFGPKQIWLCCMIGHDLLHAAMILIRLNIIMKLGQLDSMNSSEPVHQEIQLSESARVLMPDQQNDNPAVPHRNVNYERQPSMRSLHAARILELKDTVKKLTNISIYVWMGLFICWLEIDALRAISSCDSEPVINVMHAFIAIAWIWLLNPLVICMVGCLCLPVLLIVMLIFRKPSQTPASQVQINNLPIKLYNADIPGNKECAICMVDYAEGDRLIQLECSHLHHFHEDCLKSWLNINGQCPICRARIGAGPVNR